MSIIYSFPAGIEVPIAFYWSSSIIDAAFGDWGTRASTWLTGIWETLKTGFYDFVSGAVGGAAAKANPLNWFGSPRFKNRRRMRRLKHMRKKHKNKVSERKMKRRSRSVSRRKSRRRHSRSVYGEKSRRRKRR